jgi:HPt (histidine-containing phosphotransfer) domain-containing protein
MIRQFARHHVLDAAALEQAVRSQDARRVAEAAHRIVGAARTLEAYISELH